ncbi:hypothetical protein [Cellulomonas sp.]|uniref:hypothetical protein n=1 Tax=Cellulomonas sp. TaxID=40001 RepID=UPI0028120205|nr:hypothetical protein [Cellulomonas sp.]
MRELVGGVISGQEFERSWFEARAIALARAERVRRSFQRILDEVFYLLEEEYDFNPLTGRPDGISDEELLERIRLVLESLSQLERRDRPV